MGSWGRKRKNQQTGSKKGERENALYTLKSCNRRSRFATVSSEEEIKRNRIQTGGSTVEAITRSSTYLIMLLSMNTVLCAMPPERHLFSYGSYIHQFRTSHSKPRVERITLHSKESSDSDNMITRHGILVRYPSAKANIVISHGFMCTKFDVGFLRTLFPQGKFNFLTYDFRAHGEETQGQCCTFGRDEAYDVQAAVNFFRQHKELKKLPVFGYGFSMGAVASIEAQSKFFIASESTTTAHEKSPAFFDAMILDCPFDSTENVVKQALQGMKFSVFGYQFEFPGRKYLERYAFHPYVQEFIKFALKTLAHMDAKNIQTYMYRFSPAESVKKITVPTFFIHCKKDQRVPLDAIRTIYSGAQGYKRLWVTNGRNHYDSVFYNPEKYAKRINKFLTSVIDGSIKKEQREIIFEDKDENQIRGGSSPVT